MKTKSKRGYLLLETLAGAIMFSVIASSVLPAVNFLLRRSHKSIYDSKASLILQEGIEASYYIFDNDWLSFPEGRYRLAVDTSDPFNPQWTLQTLPPGEWEIVQEDFSRIIEVIPVYRDPDNQGIIADSSFPVDPNSLRIVTTVSWQEYGVGRSETAELLITNLPE